MLFIFLISSTPGATINAVGLGDEKLHINGHFFMFLLLTITNYKATKKLNLAILLSIIYGIFDEIHQMYTPNRSAGLFDIMVDAVGALIGGIIIWKGTFLLPNKLKAWLMN